MDTNLLSEKISYVFNILWLKYIIFIFRILLQVTSGTLSSKILAFFILLKLDFKWQQLIQ